MICLSGALGVFGRWIYATVYVRLDADERILFDATVYRVWFRSIGYNNTADESLLNEEDVNMTCPAAQLMDKGRKFSLTRYP